MGSMGVRVDPQEATKKGGEAPKNAFLPSVLMPPRLPSPFLISCSPFRNPTQSQHLLSEAAWGFSVGTPTTLKTSTWKTQRPGTLTLEVLVMLMTASVREPGML